jgi:cation:H+ antiporter
MSHFLLLLLSTAGLLAGGELLVRASSRIALLLGVSSLLVGLTVVSFGTSAPELFISVQSALGGHGDIAIGNVIGSNIANTLLVLGACALVMPLSVPSQLVRKEVPIMIGVSFLFYFLSIDGSIGRIDGLILVLCLSGFIYYSILSSRKDKQKKSDLESLEEILPEKGLSSNVFWNLFLGVFSLVLMSFGAKGFVYSASEIARWWGVSELVIGLTVVALGTSLPELVTSLVATYRGERDLAVGNVVGSNIFNILCVLGICATITPLSIPSAAFDFDLPVMLFSALACLPIMFFGRVITRGEGVFFVLMYFVYAGFLLLISKEHIEIPMAHEILLVFLIPVLFFTFLSLRKARNGAC